MKWVAIFSGAALLLLLSGCYFYDEMELTLYPGKKTGEIVFTNLWSDGKNAESVMKDFSRMMSDFGNDSVLGPGTLVFERELFERRGVLCARLRFRMRSPTDLDFALSDDSSRYMLRKDTMFMNTNGEETDQDGQSWYTWPVTAKKIEVKSRTASRSRSDISASLLPYWEKWKQGEIKAE